MFGNTPIAEVFAGDRGMAKVRLTNASGTTFDGPVSVTVYLSGDEAASADDVAVATVSLAELRLGSGATKSVKLKFTYADDATAGTYELLAAATVPGTNTAAAVAVARSPVTVATPTADVSVGFGGAAAALGGLAAGGSSAVSLVPGKNGKVTLTITNLGNVTAAGTLAVSLYGSADATQDAGDALLATLAGKRIGVKAGKTIKVTLKCVVPADVVPGSYFLIANGAPATTPADLNAANNVAVVGTV